MSECAVRMKMPEGCWCCPFGHYDWIWGDDGGEKMVCFCCLDLESEEDGHYLLETELKRPSWCPIICSLPEGHGDLIDRGVLLQTFQNADYETYNDYCEAFDTTEAAETIVPAEAERSEA